MTRSTVTRGGSRRDALVASAGDAIVSVDLAGRVLDWNRAAEEMFGIAAGDIVGRPIDPIVPPDRADEMTWLVKHAREGQSIRALETIRRTHDGRILRVVVTVSPIAGEHGELIGLSSIYRDVTVDEGLRDGSIRLAAYLQAVLASMDDGVLLSDAAGRIVYANLPFAQFCGNPGAQLEGAPRSEVVRSLIGRLREPELLLRFADSAPESEGEFEFTLDRPEPGVFRWASRAVPLPEGDGRLDVVSDVTNETQLREMYMRQAVTDPLTGLLNRLGGHQTIAREVARSRRHGSPLSFAMIDIDHFKRVNDRHGHGIGDDVLREVADRVGRSIRGDDALIRWGGEEFLLVLPGARVEPARELAGRIRADVAGMAVDGLPSVTVSIGLAELGPDETGAEAAIERADERLYAAKAAGRNRVE